MQHTKGFGRILFLFDSIIIHADFASESRFEHGIAFSLHMISELILGYTNIMGLMKVRTYSCYYNLTQYRVGGYTKFTVEMRNGERPR